MAFRPISSPRFIRVSRSFPEDARGRPVRLIPEIFIGFFRSRTVVCRPSCRAAGLRLVRSSFLFRQKPIYLHCARLIRIFDFVLDTPSRHNQAGACFCARLFVSLASPKILAFGNVQINLTLLSLIRIFVPYRFQAGNFMVLAEQIKEAASRRDTLEKCLDIERKRMDLQNEEEKTQDPDF